MSLWNVLVVLGVVSSIAVVRAAPAFVLAPQAPADQEDDVLDREERAAGSGGGGSGSNDYGNLSDDEDYYTGGVTPTRVRKPEIRHFHVDASITARFANTLVNSMLVNTEEYAQEATFSIVLPDQAFISKFVMVIDNVPYEAEVKEKEQAQKEYNAAKERGDTAGQVKQHVTKPNTFRVAVNVAAYSTVTFDLVYQELLRRRHGIIEYSINIDPGQIIGSMKVDIRITEPQGLQELDAMWLSTGSGSSSINEATPSSLQDVVFLDKISQSRAHIKFHPSKDQQKMERTDGIIGNLVVHYDVLHDLSAGNLQVMNGYFVHYFSPEGLAPAHKNVVFVIDVSGSMSGSKIQQTKEAMNTILADIREGDRLNIVTFTDDIRTWKAGEMVDCTPNNIKDALDFVDGLRALYGTNLHAGVMAGVSLLETSELADIQDERDAFSMVIMLTDGLPSSGTTNLLQIRNEVAARINGKFALFCLGFGDNVDQKFLEQLATENQGVGRKIYEDSSAALQLKGFYDEVATPLLFNINIKYNHINVDATTQTTFLSYFEGTEIIVAGQLPVENELTVQGNGMTELVATVSANSMDSFLELQTSVNTQTPSAAVLSRHAVDDFCQRLWAYMTIKSLLEDRTIARSREERDALKARALELSLTYHFVTPLTSLLVVRPEDKEDEVAPPIGVNDAGNEGTNEDVEQDDDMTSSSAVHNRRPAPAGTSSRGDSASRGGSAGRGGGGGGGGGGFADSDPHFVVHVPASDVSVCFDITGQPGEVYNLLTDEELGLQVMGFIVAAPEQVPGTARIRTYFGRIGVRLPGGNTVRITTDAVTVNNNMVLSWTNTVAVYKGNWTVEVFGKQVMIYKSDGSVNLVFMLHRMNPNNAYKVDHLGFYIRNHEGLTKGVHGLIGQFQRRKVQMVPFSPSDGGALLGELHVMDRTVKVVQRSRLNSLVGEKQPCWFAANNANDLIDGKHTDYLVPLETLP
ncbi:inter-alpha-trypsin inhibitor heavy chain H3-like [Asterias amurensis]|uniref:inter-alpha-trypsin inhibitor heavy chain H3-like n=1 Tax=Asterias amurensis TaxID=7602 RepID=UPI003AB3C4CE